jgi:hypothetical protein
MSWLGSPAGQQFIQNLIALAAIGLAARGVRNWNVERRDLRRAQLAEESLVAAYRAKDAISTVRSPLAYAAEGSSRTRQEGEPEDRRRDRDSAYVPFERLNRFADLFEEIQKLKYNVSAAFGTEAASPLNEFLMVRHQIFVAAKMKYMTSERGGHPREAIENQWEAVIWEGSTEPDAIVARLDSAISQLEQKFRPYVEARFKNSWRWW